MNTDEVIRKAAWEESYGRRENFVFYPCDEAVRFVSRYLRRRTGLEDVVDVAQGARASRVLDVGCGIGRNLVFGTEMGLDMHGIDLSERAVSQARTWLMRKGATGAENKVVAGDIRHLPWPDAYFAHAISDSVLDSMPFDVAQAGVAEIVRVTSPASLLYCNLISGDETGRDAEFDGEEIVRSVHERDTYQSYFNRRKVDRLLGPSFEVLSCVLHQASDPDRAVRHGRWHVVARRR